MHVPMSKLKLMLWSLLLNSHTQLIKHLATDDWDMHTTSPATVRHRDRQSTNDFDEDRQEMEMINVACKRFLQESAQVGDGFMVQSKWLDVLRIGKIQYIPTRSEYSWQCSLTFFPLRRFFGKLILPSVILIELIIYQACSPDHLI